MKMVSGKHLCRILEYWGWELKRVHGSHYIYTHPDNSKILTVPVHGNKDLKKSTLGQLLKDANLTEQDL